MLTAGDIHVVIDSTVRTLMNTWIILQHAISHVFSSDFHAFWLGGCHWFASLVAGGTVPGKMPSLTTIEACANG